MCGKYLVANTAPNIKDIIKARTIDYLIKQTRILHIKKSQNFNNILTPVGEQLTKTDKEFGWDLDRIRTIITNELNNNYEY